VEVRGSQSTIGGLSHKDVETLRLANIRSPRSCKIDQLFLRNLPDGLVQVFKVLRQFFDLLDATVVGDKLVSDVVIPLS